MKFEDAKDELLSAIDSALKSARVKDKEAEFEIYLLHQSSAKVEIRQGTVEATDGVTQGNAVRVAKNRSVSFASSSGISTDRIKRSIDEALRSLKSVSIRDPQFEGFCKPKKPGKEGIFTPEILDLDSEELAKLASVTVEEAQKFDKRILAAGATCSVEWGAFAVANTQGLQQASKSASNSCQVYSMASKMEERKVAYDYDISRERLINTEGLGRKAAQKAISLLGAKKLNKTAVLPTIWEPIPAAAYVHASLGQSVNGQAVVEGRSPLADKIGKEIANRSLTIIDDGQDPASVMTEAIDAEGYPQQSNVVIEKGVLEHFMFDSYHARIHGVESTGNCSRGGGPFGSSLPYETRPAISPRFFRLKPGIKSADELISHVDGQAILIADMPIGIFHSSVSTGEFSIVAQSAFLVQKGEKKWPLQAVSLSGNFYKGFKQIRAIGKDSEKTPLMVETPSLVFEGFSIVG